MADLDIEMPPTMHKVLRNSRAKDGGLPLSIALSPGRIALLQLIVKFPGVSRAKLLTIPGITLADLDYLAANDLIKPRPPAQFRATHHGEIVGKRGW